MKKKKARTKRRAASIRAAEKAKERAGFERCFSKFVDAAWKVLEPVTELRWNWHLTLLCEYLQAARKGKIRRLIINVPPRTMKSTLVTVCWPAWWWATEPTARFMMASYAEDLAKDHSLFRRNLMQSEWYQGNWGKSFKFAKDQNVKTLYENSKRGRMFATSMAGTATGKGGDVVIIDDPQNPKTAFSDVVRESINRNFDATFRTRLNDPAKGVIVIVMQRLHERDLTGHVLAKEPGVWEHICLPAIAEKHEVLRFPLKRRRTKELQPGDLLWEKRLSRPVLDELKNSMGTWAFSGQYQQAPAPAEGNIVKHNWVQFYRELPAEFECLIQSWDCSFKDSRESDFVVGQVWGRVPAGEGKVKGAKYYLVDQVRARMDFVATKNAICTFSAKYPQAITKLVEDKANGPAVIAALKAEVDGLIAVNPDGGKISRLTAVSPLFEAGNVYLPAPERAAWVHDYVHELCMFPAGANDDQVDATSQALIRLRKPQEDGIFAFYRQQAESKAPRRVE